MLKLAIRLPFLSDRDKLRMRRSLIKAQTGDLVASLRKYETAPKPSMIRDETGAPQPAPSTHRGLVVPDSSSVSFDDAAGASASIESHAVPLPNHEALDPKPVGYRFSGILPGLLTAETRGAWLQENREAVTKLLIERFAGYDTLSLDVFDTYLLRGPEAEAARFLEFSGFVIDQLATTPFQPLVDGISPESLALMRARAMQSTYRFRPRVNGCNEGSIDEVAQNVASSLGGGQDLAEALLDLEVEFEARKLAPNPVLGDLVRHFKERGGRAILISDMYLHGPQIEAICRKVDPESFGAIDTVFSSADTITNKRSGTLFGVVQERLSLDPAKTVHVGDSSRSDVEMARLSGWNAMHFPISRPEALARERSLHEVVDHFDRAGIDVRDWAKV